MIHPANNSKRRCPRSYKRLQLGVGLIEILIAVLVLSIGILGIAALQTRALADNGGALNKSAATAATYSIIEGLRLDRANAVAANYNHIVTTDNCPGVGTTLSEYLLSKWCADQLGKFIGTASTTSGQIFCDANGSCTITIKFNETNAGSTTNGVSQFELKTNATI